MLAMPRFDIYYMRHFHARHAAYVIFFCRHCHYAAMMAPLLHYATLPLPPLLLFRDA